jgi:phage FluMu gp28-like protein
MAGGPSARQHERRLLAQAHARIVAGLDVGRESDLTVLTVLAVTADGHAWRIASLHCKRTKFKAQRKMVDDARKMLGFKRLVVDETGLGKQFAEELVEAYGEEEVEALTFTNEAKADLATRGLRFLRGGKLHVPTDDEGKALRAEMVALRRQVTPAGNIVYHSPRTRLGHGDRLWSLLCALRAADQPELARGMFTGFGQGVSR